MTNTLKILFIGDVVGVPGLKILKEYLPLLKEKYSSEFIIVNGENACNGKGLTETESKEIFDAGANVITSGNHIWENWKTKALLADATNILRPYNYPPGCVGRSFCYDIVGELTICVLQLQGRTYMQAIDCPFRGADNILKKISQKTNIIIVDFHADATAEKLAMGWHLDGRVSAVLGTHTHVQTADARIMPGGTAYISDVGMTGASDSVVGMKKDIALRRYIYQTPHKYEVAEGDPKISGAFIEINPEDGKAVYIEPFILPEFNKRVESNSIHEVS